MENGEDTSEGAVTSEGRSRTDVSTAIRAAVEAYKGNESKLVVTRIEVTVEGDPHVGEYIVTMGPGG